MKKLVLILFILIESVGFNCAAKVRIGQLYYNLDTKNGTAEVTYTSNDGSNYSNISTSVITVPASVSYNGRSYTVVGLGESALCGVGLTKITLPNTLKYIGKLSLSWSNMTSVNIPSSVITIADSAFSTSWELQSVTIPANVRKIGVGAFENCGQLKAINVVPANQHYSSINGVLYNKDKTTLILYPLGKGGSTYTIPNTVKKIAASAFEYCVFTSVIIPDNVESIGNYAFRAFVPNTSSEECELTSIYIGSGLQKLGKFVFSSCGLTSIQVSPNNPYFCTIDGVLFSKDKTRLILYPSGRDKCSYTVPSSVTTIESGAFDSSVFSTLTIPSSVKTIKTSAFTFCGINTLSIGCGVTSIEKEAFVFCDFDAINVAPANQHYSSINGVLFNKDVTTIYYYPSGKHANSYTIPNSVTRIASGAFHGGVRSIIIGPNMKYIEQFGIGDEDGEYVNVDEDGEGDSWELISVTCKAAIPPICEDFAIQGSIDTYLYVPQGSVKLYMTAKGWDDFVNENMNNIRPIR